jgi:hypothetical protein
MDRIFVSQNQKNPENHVQLTEVSYKNKGFAFGSVKNIKYAGATRGARVCAARTIS